MPSDPDDLEELMEDVAAISAEFHGHKHFRKFYDRYCDELEGFTGIWMWMVHLARAFHAETVKHQDEMDGDWIDLIYEFIALLYARLADQEAIPDDAELQAIAQQAFHNILVTDKAIREKGHNEGVSTYAKIPGKPLRRVKPRRTHG